MENKHRQERFINLIENNIELNNLTESINELLVDLNSNSHLDVEKIFKQQELILLVNELGLLFFRCI